MAGEPSFLRRPPTLRQNNPPRIGEAIKRCYLFFFLATFFFATFFLAFFTGFFLAAFFFAMVLITSFRQYSIVKKNLAFQIIILFYRPTSQEVLKHFIGRIAKANEDRNETAGK